MRRQKMQLTRIPRSSLSYLALSSSWTILAEVTLIPDLLGGTTHLLGYLPPSHRTKSHKAWYSPRTRRRLASRLHPSLPRRQRAEADRDRDYFSPIQPLQYSADTICMGKLWLPRCPLNGNFRPGVHHPLAQYVVTYRSWI